ncbi:short chain dehydrogenase [Microscilla marina]|uniref:Short chain dehydrogenase n=1 Tax=Microscilla marina ATCC 23134 TaxID=313606 RepID=A1ZCU3_MICM2|nr:short chain dehydrogenase [Microscilla marina]EAY32095.1 short chain dehydrogenase [Microscilla marina ATCC 23134]
MKILIIGGHGTLGKVVTDYFAQKHEVLVAGRSKGDLTIDIADSASIEAGFAKAGKLDAVICIAGEAKWAHFDELSEQDYHIGINSKLMGQVNVTRIAQRYLHPQGSVTLTTGILADDPVPFTTSAAMVNGAIHSFVKAVVLDLQNGIRVNVVSPGLVEAAADKYRDYFPGHIPVTMQQMLSGYIRSVEGKGNGEVIRIY